MTDPDRLLAGLTEEQREAVTVDAAPLLVLAGAGSGKTRVLTRRIAWRAVTDRLDPRRVLAVTFTRKAASELHHRLVDLGVAEQVSAGTFHALALAQLRRHWADRRQATPKLLDRKTKLLVRILGSDARLAGPVAREIEWAQARVVAPDAYEEVARSAWRPAPLPPSEMARVFAEYEREKRRRGVVDFDDLLARCAEALERDPELAAANRWRFRHLFVDELQDVNPAQFRLLRAWLGPRSDLCAVGDDEQAIYGFGGSDSRYVGEFAHHFGQGERVTVLRLTANFRSTPQILELANAVLSPAAASERPLRAVTGDGPSPEITAYESDVDEALGVVRTVARLQREGVRHGAMAVLARTNAQCGALEAALRGARIPARVRGGERLVDRPLVQQGMRELTDALARDPERPFPSLLRTSVAQLAETTMAVAEPALMATLTELAGEYAATEGDLGSPDGFAAFLSTALASDDPLPQGDAVEVLTFHRAKGLEWPVVFVTGLEDGFVPISHASTDAARAEERRLLHVALTRAGRHLFLSWARQRTFGDRTVSRERSPFLPALEQRLPPIPPEGAGTGNGERVGRAALEEALAGLQQPAPGVVALHEHERDALWQALLAWRTQRARAADVPDAAILDDDVLRLICERRPGDPDELATVVGLGPSRLARFGPEILDVVAGYAG